AELDQLQELRCDNNTLDSNLPSSFSSARLVWKSLEVFSCSSNLLDGSIPRSLYDAVTLKELRLHNNRIVGTLSSQLMENWREIQLLDVSSNYLEGTIPETIVVMSLLRELKIDNNRLAGSIPAGIEKLLYLEILYAHSNFL